MARIANGHPCRRLVHPVIEPNTEIKIEYTSAGALHLSMWRRGNATPEGLRKFEDLPYDVETRLRGALHEFITKGSQDDSNDGTEESGCLASPA